MEGTQTSAVTRFSFKGDTPLHFHPIGQMEGSRGFLVLFHSVFLYAQELTEITVLCSKETFRAKGETRLLNVTIKHDPCCWCSSLIGGRERPTGTTRLPGGSQRSALLPACLCCWREGLHPGRRSCPLSLWQRDWPALA